MAIGVVPEALQARQPHHRQQRADMEARGGRIETDVSGDALRWRASARPSVASYTMPRQSNSS